MIKRFDCGVYPRLLWVASSDCAKAIRRKFTYRDGSEVDDLDDENVGTCVTVTERKTGRYGYLLVFSNDCDMSTVVHESNHAALHILKDVGAGRHIASDQEPFCYLSDWVFRCAEPIAREIMNKKKDSDEKD